MQGESKPMANSAPAGISPVMILWRSISPITGEKEAGHRIDAPSLRSLPERDPERSRRNRATAPQ